MGYARRSNEKKSRGGKIGRGRPRWDNKEDDSETELLRGSMTLGGKFRENG